MLSGKQLDVNFKTKQVLTDEQRNQRGFFGFKKKSKPRIDKIIIHIHEGGFVSMSSRFSQQFLRLWSNELGVPVFSIDYRLAPGSAYPDPLDDCY